MTVLSAALILNVTPVFLTSAATVAISKNCTPGSRLPTECVTITFAAE